MTESALLHPVNSGLARHLRRCVVVKHPGLLVFGPMHDTRRLRNDVLDQFRNVS